MKNTITEMKNTLQGISSRVDEAENQINDLEYNKEKNKQTNKKPQNKNPTRTAKRKRIQKRRIV